MLQHRGTILSEQSRHCAGLYHGTRTMNSSRVCDCLLSVRAATMATHAWTKLHTQVMSWISGVYPWPWSDFSHHVYCLWVCCETGSLMVHSWVANNKLHKLQCMLQLRASFKLTLHSGSSPSLSLSTELKTADVQSFWNFWIRSIKIMWPQTYIHSVCTMQCW